MSKRIEVPASFAVGSKVIRSVGLDGKKKQPGVITRVNKLHVTDNSGLTYYATAETATTGVLAQLNNKSRWASTLRLAPQQ